MSGGRGRRAVAFVWTVLLMTIVVVVGVVTFGGFLPDDPFASPTPLTAASFPATPSDVPSLAPSPSAEASEPVGASPSADPFPSLSVTPAVATPRPTLPPRVTPSAVATIAPLATPSVLPASPGPTILATPSAVPLPTRAPTPTEAPTPAPTATPDTLGPTPTGRPVATPGPITSTASPRAPGPSAFVCDGASSLRDPFERGWRLNGIYWAERAEFDRITLRLVPESSLDGRVPRVNVETRPIREVVDDLGLPRPTQGDVAVVVRFSNAVALTRQLQGTPEKPAVRALTATATGDGRVWAVLGVSGDGCFALQVPAWDDPSTQNTPFVDVTVDVQH